jgi:ribonuclease HII
VFCGIDEAGRGSVMGPLVVGAVYVGDDAALRAIGVKDSKRLSAAARERMHAEILDACDHHCTVIVSAGEIDALRQRQSLNAVETDMFLRAASEMPVATVYADCPERSEMMFSSRLSARLKNTEVIGRHGADDTYPVVSAASIVAKVTRDRLMERIAQELGEPVGSGYPGDRVTMDFIRARIERDGEPPAHVRRSWEPVREMMSAARNTRLTDW